MTRLTGVSVMIKERLLFFRRWLDNPLQLGAFAPSSRALAEMVAERVVRENKAALVRGDYLIELGAGTGAFTEALLAAGVRPEQLVSIELDPSLHSHLVTRFPHIKALQGDASLLETLLPKDIRENVAAVVSGIPMMMVSREIQGKIISGIFGVLKEKGCLYQFTYSPFSSIGVKNFNLKKRRLGTVFRNFPPATVWVYERSSHYSIA